MTRQDRTGQDRRRHDTRRHDTTGHDRRRNDRDMTGEDMTRDDMTVPSDVPGERVLVKSTLANWPIGKDLGLMALLRNARGLNPRGCHWGPSPIRTRDWNPRHHFPNRLPSPSPAPAPTPAAAPAPIHTPAPGIFQTQKYISSPSSRSSEYLPFVDATSPKPRKALHSAVVLRMRPCTKIHVSSPGKNVVKNLSLP